MTVIGLRPRSMVGFMKKLEILTNRFFVADPVWHLVHEWEDVFASTLNIRIRKRILFALLMKCVFQLGRLRLPVNLNKIYECLDDLYLRYCSNAVVFRVDMYPRSANYLGPRREYVIPYIIDFDRNVSLAAFTKTYAEHKLVLISSYNAFRYLTGNGQHESNLRHLPLSLPDKYEFDRTIYYQRREFDLILPGRPNKRALSWLAQFATRNPNFEYLSYRSIDNRHVYVSNKGREFDCRTRQAYLTLLRDCKIAVYSTQGVDGNRESFDHITAKLFEGICAGCLMIGLYPETDESVAFRVSDVCPSVREYDDFERTLLLYMTLDRDEEGYERYADFLSANRTSSRAKHLAESIRSKEFLDSELAPHDTSV